MSAVSPLAQRIRAVLELVPTAPALEFDGRWRTWGELARTVDDLERALGELQCGPGTDVGVLLRNQPVAFGLLLGVLCAEACVVALNPELGGDRVRADLASLTLPLVAGSTMDVAKVAPHGARTSAILSLHDVGEPPDLDVPANAPQAAPPDDRGIAVRILTSGTTGPPKRIDLTYETLERVMQGAKHYEGNRRSDVSLRQGVVIVTSPLAHVSGLFRVLQAILDGRRIALLERFTVDGWADAVRRHRPKTASLNPTALRMVLESDLEPDVFESLLSVVSGTAPLDPDVADTFTERFGVPVLTSYGATEFGGGVAGWNLADYQRFGRAKRGSAGRAHPGCELRVVDADSFETLPPGEVGLLEVKAAQLADAGWVRTTDLARCDADGFLWIVGRADQTILRGGFKVQPDVVGAALERHPAVRGAAVFGVDDERLGQVPVAAVELRAGNHVEEAQLLAHARSLLAPYEVPARLVVVDELPRTPSAKVDLQRARALVTDGRRTR